MKTTGLIFLALCISIGISAGTMAESPIWAPPPLAGLIEEGLTRNKEIKSLEDEVEGLKQEIPFAGSLEDPRLGFVILNLPTDTFDFDQEAMTQKQIFIAQKFPWFGKLDLRTQRATLRAIRQQSVLDTRRLELARKIAVAHYELGFVETSLKTNTQLTDMEVKLAYGQREEDFTGRDLPDFVTGSVTINILLWPIRNLKPNTVKISIAGTWRKPLRRVLY